MAGVVSRPVSELGERGGSPAQCPREHTDRPDAGRKAELACHPEQGTVPVKSTPLGVDLVGAGIARYCKPKWSVGGWLAN